MNNKPFHFIGSGHRAELLPRLAEINPINGDIGPWHRGEGDIEPNENAFGHPAGYIASGDLAEAVNTALILRKPLLLTGNPGTGKSELAERVAWEFNLGPVLRFEAHSLCEAADLFYRFDLVGQMAAANMAKHANLHADPSPERFIGFGPLGKAILLSAPAKHEELFRLAFPNTPADILPKPRPSVVLIDEIDKAGRDFPNDLLNGIERLEFHLRPLQDRVVKVPDQDDLKPIVIITSNLERDLPGPFLRRCAYFHIDDPDEDLLRRIVHNRVFPEYRSGPDGDSKTQLPNLYEELLKFFISHRDKRRNEFSYEPSAAELIDWSRALNHLSQAGQVDAWSGLTANYPMVRASAGAVAKSRDDRKYLLDALDQACRPA